MAIKNCTDLGHTIASLVNEQGKMGVIRWNGKQRFKIISIELTSSLRVAGLWM